MDSTLALTTDMKLVLGLVLLTVVLFVFERPRADPVALVVPECCSASPAWSRRGPCSTASPRTR